MLRSAWLLILAKVIINSISPYRMVWRAIPGSRVYLVYTFLFHTSFFISAISKQKNYHGSLVSSSVRNFECRLTVICFSGNLVCQCAEWTDESTACVNGQRRSNRGGVIYARPIISTLPAPVSYRLIVIRALNGQTKKKRLSIHTFRVLFATDDPNGISIMQPNMQP